MANEHITTIERGMFTVESHLCPFFYVIRHVASGRLYAGSKYSRRTPADWSTFMQPGGYTTSSKHINTLIAAEGLKAFSIELLVCEPRLADVFNPQGMTEVGAYEDWFIDHYDIIRDPMWFNKSRGGHIHLKKHRMLMEETVPGTDITFYQQAARR
jgi:hypothetical protein